MINHVYFPLWDFLGDSSLSNDLQMIKSVFVLDLPITNYPIRVTIVMDFLLLQGAGLDDPWVQMAFTSPGSTSGGKKGQGMNYLV